MQYTRITRAQAVKLFRHRDERDNKFENLRVHHDNPYTGNEILLSDGSKLCASHSDGCWHYGHMVYDCGGSKLQY